MIYHGIPIRKKNHTEATNKGRLKGFKNPGTVGCTPNSVPMAFVVFLRGFSGIITPKYPLYRAYKGVSHRGTLVGAHPTIPWKKKTFFASAKLRSHAIAPPLPSDVIGPRIFHQPKNPAARFSPKQRWRWVCVWKVRWNYDFPVVASPLSVVFCFDFSTFSLKDILPVDGRNPAPPEMCKTL